MSLTAKRLIRVAQKLGYLIREGTKHTLVHDPRGKLITTIPRGKIKKKTLSRILKQLGISEARLKKLL